MLTLEEAQARLLRTRAGRPSGDASRWPMPSGGSSPIRGSSPRSTSRRSRTPRWTASRCAPPMRPASFASSARSPPARPRSSPVEAGTAVRIMTGAPLPPGADAVVPVEDVAEADGVVVACRRRCAAGAYVRDGGARHASRRRDLLPGPLSPARLAVLASLGHRRGRRCGGARSSRSCRPATSSSGPGEPLGPGQIHDANGRGAGGRRDRCRRRAAASCARVGDDPEAIERALLTRRGVGRPRRDVGRRERRPPRPRRDRSSEQRGSPRLLAHRGAARQAAGGGGAGRRRRSSACPAIR